MEYHSFYSLFKIHWLILGFVAAYFYIKKVVHSQIYSIITRQKVYFFIALSLVFILKVTPLDLIGHSYLFSFHVVQISLIVFVVAPLFILSFLTNFYRRDALNHPSGLFINLLSNP